MPNSFTKIIDLVKKTGDNCVILDNEGNPAYVIVSFSDYRKMILGKSGVAGLTEDELLVKINPDIATWMHRCLSVWSDQRWGPWNVFFTSSEDSGASWGETPIDTRGSATESGTPRS